MKRPRTVAQAPAERGGWYHGPWLTRREVAAAERRWRIRSLAGHPPGDKDQANQCGGCRWFAAYGADDGVCVNQRSRFDGLIVFEHGSCPAFNGGP